MKIAVLGCGNMATPIVEKIAQTADHSFYTYTPSFTKAEALAKKVNGQSVKELKELPCVDYVILGCKPQQFSSLCSSLSEVQLGNPTYISLLAATPLDVLEKKLDSANVVRVMPNTPVAVEEGISLFCSNKEKDKTILDLFSKTGLCLWVSEKDLDVATVVAGSGPAYVYYFAKTLSDFLEKEGLSKEVSKLITDQLFIGSSKLLKGKDNQKLIDQVTSKGGTTIEAIRVYQNDMDVLTNRALTAAKNRVKEIAQELNSID